MSDLNECPVCSKTLHGGEKHKAADEAHISACIASRLDQQATLEGVPQSQVDDDSCPVCQISFLSKGFQNSGADRNEHVSACLEAQDTVPMPKQYAPPKGAPPYSMKGKDTKTPMGDEGGGSSKIFEAMPPPQSLTDEKSYEKLAGNKPKATVDGAATSRRPSLMSRLSVTLKRDPESREKKAIESMEKVDELMDRRWGPPGSPCREMVTRYWVATRMQQHWEFLRAQHPRQFRRHMGYGYMEPIPIKWVYDRRLAYPNPEFSLFETPAEERLYYLLNNGVMPDGSRHAPLRPLNVNRDMYKIIKRGNERNARQVPIPADKIQHYRSAADVFQSDRRIKSHEYSQQVPNTVYDARRQALHELADGIIHGTDHLETMLLIDVSSSMTWDPHGGMTGPDGITRYHDQPANILLVKHLVHRVLNHMIPRAQKEHPHQTGVDAVTFSSYGTYVGQISARNFNRDWNSRMSLGGGTQVMQGWQVVKNTYFKHQHDMYGHGRYDPIYGWQATPGMPKLSLLVFLDGEAMDMDEFELELLGETWAYVTIALVGMENCPHHHSHAVELERVARFNPHVGFFDVHGRVLERLCVEELLGSVYPVDPPAYAEILKPEYDLRPEEDLPGYAP